MSVAFRRESDEEHLEPRFELPIPPGPNLVAERGLALIVDRIAGLEAALTGTGDEAGRKDVQRDLRYWRARRSSARVTPVGDGSEVGFGTRVRYRLAAGPVVSIAIVGHDEADPANGLIAFTAPLARALIGAGAGDRVDFAGTPDAIEILAVGAIDIRRGRATKDAVPRSVSHQENAVPPPDIDTPHQPRPLPSAERMQALLFDAAREGRCDMIAALLEYGAKIVARDGKGHTALILAAYHGHAGAVDLLLASGADADAGDAVRGNTALMGVAFKGHDPVAACLLAAGCAVDARNHAGQTALMMAAMFDRREQVAMLLRAGADPAIADTAGNTAATLAHGQRNHDLAARLAVLREQAA